MIILLAGVIGCHEEALADYDTALRLQPNYVQAYNNRGALHCDRGDLRAALRDFEEAERRGHPSGAHNAALIRQMLGRAPAPLANPAQQALAAFADADSAEALRRAVAQFQHLLQPNFIAAIEQAITQEAPAHQRPAFQQRLAWLRQIAVERGQG